MACGTQSIDEVLQEPLIKTALLWHSNYLSEELNLFPALSELNQHGCLTSDQKSTIKKLHETGKAFEANQTLLEHIELLSGDMMVAFLETLHKHDPFLCDLVNDTIDKVAGGLIPIYSDGPDSNSTLPKNKTQAKTQKQMICSAIQWHNQFLIRRVQTEDICSGLVRRNLMTQTDKSRYEKIKQEDGEAEATALLLRWIENLSERELTEFIFVEMKAKHKRLYNLLIIDTMEKLKEGRIPISNAMTYLHVPCLQKIKIENKLHNGVAVVEIAMVFAEPHICTDICDYVESFEQFCDSLENDLVITSDERLDIESNFRQNNLLGCQRLCYYLKRKPIGDIKGFLKVITTMSLLPLSIFVQSLLDQCEKVKEQVDRERMHEISHEKSDPISVQESDSAICDAHPEKTIVAYCSQCDTVLCQQCRADHNTKHIIIDLNQAVETLVPTVRQQLTVIDQMQLEGSHYLHQIDSEVLRVKNNFCKFRKSVNKRLQQKVDNLKKERDQLIDDSREQEQRQLSKLQDQRINIWKLQQTIISLENRTQAILSNRNQATLMATLVRGGLKKKLNEITCTTIIQDICWAREPCLEGGTTLSLGEMVLPNRKFGTRHFNGNYRDILSGSLKEIEEIQLDSHSSRFTIYEENAYIPFMNDRRVRRYSVNGKLEKTHLIHGKPTSIEKVTADNILVACLDTGLHVLNEKTDETECISEGCYSDVCVFKEFVYTWDFKTKQVVQFLKDRKNTWRQGRVVSVDWMQNPSSGDTLLVRDTRNHKSKLEFIIGAYQEDTAYQVNCFGAKVGQFGSKKEQGDGKLHGPSICGVDLLGQVLVADLGNSKYKLLDTHSGSWTTVIETEGYVCDAKITDQAVWFSRYNRDKIKVSKCVLPV